MLFADSVDDNSASLTCRTYVADLGSGTRTISAVSMFMIHLISARKACELFSLASVAASLGTRFFTIMANCYKSDSASQVSRILGDS